MSALGADHVFVSGSGPTVAGLFWGDDSGQAAAAAAALAGRYPGAVAVDAGRAPRSAPSTTRVAERPAGLCGSIVGRVGHNWRRRDEQPDDHLPGRACLGVFGLAAFCALVLVPAITAYRRPVERVAVVILSLYVLAALVGLGVLVGALVVFEWPRVF